MAKTHVFKESLSRGARAERLLDNLLSERYVLHAASKADQKRGIDRYALSRLTHERTTLEYKCDWRAGDTGNVFVETATSIGRPGWAKGCRATWLVYYLPHQEQAFLIKVEELQQRLPRWEHLYQSRTIPTKGYHENYTVSGLLVPIREFEKLAWETLHAA
ncbi:MAG: hypothetical protein ACO1RX_20055 [Candidatus Sericytochromatia bacterium]